MNLHAVTAEQWLFIASNFAIFCGYLFTAIAIAPYFRIKKWITRFAGVWFFFTCGLTHLELALHLLEGSGMPMSEFTSWHMQVVHVGQAVAVWFFVLGIHEEFVRGVRRSQNGEQPGT
jgi:amino acid transporter